MDGASTSEHGHDIRAARGAIELIVEAKGGTSALHTSKRFGRPFNASQVHSHVGRALVAAMQAITEGKAAAIALPDDRLHRQLIAKIEVGLRNARIFTSWVGDDARTVLGLDELDDLTTDLA